MTDFSDYALRQSKSTREYLSKVPAPVKATITSILLSFGEHLQRHPERIRSERKVKVYTHPRPAIEITFLVDSKRRLIDCVNVVVQTFTPSVMVFVSYSHQNADIFTEFRPFMIGLERRGQVRFFHDQKIKPGTKWEQEISDAIEQSRIAVLFVTQQFLASSFIHDVELPLILENHERGELDIHWVPVGYALIENDDPLSKLQAVADAKTPIYSLPKSDREREYREVARKIIERVREVTDASE